VCATRTFAGEAIYADDEVLHESEIQQRVEEYWEPYHDRIAAELERIGEEHPLALLWDAHSIASEIPELFPGLLPQFNLGTRDDSACPARVVQALAEEVRASGKYSVAVNGRFKGGYITMQYGRPSHSVYAVQLELAERTYMSESPRGEWDPALAAPAMQCIERLLTRYLGFATLRS
jgi:N-formylglutamate deformylase